MNVLANYLSASMLAMGYQASTSVLYDFIFFIKLYRWNAGIRPYRFVVVVVVFLNINLFDLFHWCLLLTQIPLIIFHL